MRRVRANCNVTLFAVEVEVQVIGVSIYNEVGRYTV